MSVVAVGDPRPAVRTAVEAIVASSPTKLHEIEPWETAIERCPAGRPERPRTGRVHPDAAAAFSQGVERPGVTATLICPLRARGQVIGTLGLWRRGERAEHSHRDQSFAQEMADRAALAIDNARLVQAAAREVEERKRHEENMQLSTELLHRAEEKRRALIANLVSAEEEQRRRIAVDVHDDFDPGDGGHGAAPPGAAPPRPDARLRRAGSPRSRRRWSSSIGRLRQLLFQLDAPSVDEGGLARAMSRYLDELFPEAPPRRPRSAPPWWPNRPRRRAPSSTASPRRASTTCASTRAPPRCR